MQRPSLLDREQPLDALCHHFGLQSIIIQPGTPFPAAGTFDMSIYVPPPVIRDPRRDRDAPPPLPAPPPLSPTHVIAASGSDQPGVPPLMLPVDAALFARGFRFELPLPADASPPARTGDVLRLPLITLSVPYPYTLPLLLLYGMGIEREPNVMAWALLPVNVVEEFPNAAAMALVLARVRPDRFERVFKHNQGLWRNVLAMGLCDPTISQLVQTAWNVTAEARRIRQRGAM